MVATAFGCVTTAILELPDRHGDGSAVALLTFYVFMQVVEKHR
jgi:hypothetical protein